MGKRDHSQMNPAQKEHRRHARQRKERNAELRRQQREQRILSMSNEQIEQELTRLKRIENESKIQLLSSNKHIKDVILRLEKELEPSKKRDEQRKEQALLQQQKESSIHIRGLDLIFGNNLLKAGDSDKKVDLLTLMSGSDSSSDDDNTDPYGYSHSASNKNTDRGYIFEPEIFPHLVLLTAANDSTDSNKSTKKDEKLSDTTKNSASSLPPIEPYEPILNFNECPHLVVVLMKMHINL
jgi:hypothetical protein